jgi:hypothetical protein
VPQISGLDPFGINLLRQRQVVVNGQMHSAMRRSENKSLAQANGDLGGSAKQYRCNIRKSTEWTLLYRASARKKLSRKKNVEGTRQCTLKFKNQFHTIARVVGLLTNIFTTFGYPINADKITGVERKVRGSTTFLIGRSVR